MVKRVDGSLPVRWGEFVSFRRVRSSEGRAEREEEDDGMRREAAGAGWEVR